MSAEQEVVGSCPALHPSKTVRNEADLRGRTISSSGPLGRMDKIVRCSANRSRTRALQTRSPTLRPIHREPEPPRPDGTPYYAVARRGRAEIGETTRVG